MAVRCNRRQLRHLISDSLVALAIVVMHGTIIMCQGMAFSVAMNSKRSSALVALLIASNFVEIKGMVGPPPCNLLRGAYLLDADSMSITW